MRRLLKPSMAEGLSLSLEWLMQGWLEALKPPCTHLTCAKCLPNLSSRGAHPSVPGARRVSFNFLGHSWAIRNAQWFCSLNG